MKRKPLPRYGFVEPVLTAERVHLIRVSGKTDSYWARRWKLTTSAIQAARVGATWRDHSTPPDTRPRTGAGRFVPDGEARFVQTPAADINSALRSWGAPPVIPTATHSEQP